MVLLVQENIHWHYLDQVLFNKFINTWICFDSEMFLIISVTLFALLLSSNEAFKHWVRGRASICAALVSPGMWLSANSYWPHCGQKKARDENCSLNCV